MVLVGIGCVSSCCDLQVVFSICRSGFVSSVNIHVDVKSLAHAYDWLDNCCLTVVELSYSRVKWWISIASPMPTVLPGSNQPFVWDGSQRRGPCTSHQIRTYLSTNSAGSLIHLQGSLSRRSYALLVFERVVNWTCVCWLDYLFVGSPLVFLGVSTEPAWTELHWFKHNLEPCIWTVWTPF